MSRLRMITCAAHYDDAEISPATKATFASTMLTIGAQSTLAAMRCGRRGITSARWAKAKAHGIVGP